MWYHFLLGVKEIRCNYWKTKKEKKIICFNLLYAPANLSRWSWQALRAQNPSFPTKSHSLIFFFHTHSLLFAVHNHFLQSDLFTSTPHIRPTTSYRQENGKCFSLLLLVSSGFYSSGKKALQCSLFAWNLWALSFFSFFVFKIPTCLGLKIRWYFSGFLSWLIFIIIIIIIVLSCFSQCWCTDIYLLKNLKVSFPGSYIMHTMRLIRARNFTKSWK